MLKSTVIVLSLAITAVPAAPQTPPTGQRFTLAGNMLRGYAAVQRNLLEAARQNQQATPPKKGDEARSIVEQYFDAYRARDVERLVNLFAPHAVFEDPTFRIHQQGRDGIRRLATDMRAGFGDVSIEIHSIVADGNMVATEETIAGVLTHDGRRRPIKVRAASFFLIRDGLIHKVTDYSDVQTFNEQSRAGG